MSEPDPVAKAGRCALAGLAALAALALAAPPLILLVDAAHLALAGWRPLGTGDRLVLAACAAWVAAAFGVLAVPALRRLLGRHAGRLALLVVGLLLGWGEVEAVLAVTARPPGFHLRPPGMHRVHHTDPAVMPGIEGDSTYTTDSLGIRAGELPAERSVPRVLFVGGSTTECLYLDDSETWPHLVGERLNADPDLGPVWVGAIGLAGYSSAHDLKFLEQSELVRAGELDAVGLLVGVNDLWKVYLGVTEEQQLAGDLRPLWARSRLAGLLHGLVDRWRASRGGGLEHWAYHVPRQQRQRAEGEKLDRGPDLAPWLDAYERRLERIAAVARERGLRPFFLTQPVQWAEGLPPEIEQRFWFGWVEGGGYVSARVLREGMEAFNRRLLEVAARLDVPCLDLSSMHGDARWFFDDCHFSEAGARRAAELVAEWMRAHPEAWRP